MNMLREGEEYREYPDPLKGDASPGRPQTSKVYGYREVSFGTSFGNNQVLD